MLLVEIVCEHDRNIAVGHSGQPQPCNISFHPLLRWFVWAFVSRKQCSEPCEPGPVRVAKTNKRFSSTSISITCLYLDDKVRCNRGIVLCCYFFPAAPTARKNISLKIPWLVWDAGTLHDTRRQGMMWWCCLMLWSNTDNLFLFYTHLNLPCQPKFPTNYLIYADGWVGVVLLITGFNLTRMFNLSHRICKCTFYLAYYVCNVI